MRNRPLPVLISLLLAFVLYGPAAAQDDPTPPPAEVPQGPVFGIQTNPVDETGYFAVTLEPGASASLEARVITINSIPLTLRAYATNALSLVNGGFGAGMEDDTLTPPATWLSFPAQTFDLDTTDFLDIPFTVSVPGDASPGQYVAALIAQTDGPLPITGSGAFNQVIRSSLPVVITVPGPVQAAFTTGTPGIDPAGQVSIPVTNTGNILVRPTGQISIAGSDGVPVAQIPITMGSVFAGTATTIEFALPGEVVPGTYAISGTLTDPESQASSTIEPVSVMIAAPAPALPPTFAIDSISVTPTGDPVQFATIAIAIDNQGGNIATGTVVLNVYKDDALVENYVLAQNQAMPYGQSTIETRYVPVTGWEQGTYRFEVEVSSVDAGGNATVISTATSEDEIVIP